MLFENLVWHAAVTMPIDSTSATIAAEITINKKYITLHLKTSISI